MPTIISRAPNDSFTFNLFDKLTSGLSTPSESYYLWATPPDHFESFLKIKQFSQPLVILAIKDLLDLWQSFNFWHDTQQAGVAALAACVRRHPNTQFIILTSLEGLEKELVEPNLQIVPWGGDITNQASVYPSLQPVLDKNFDSQQAFISLNRNRRDHRLVTLSYLLGKGYEQSGQITYLGQQIDVQRFDNLLDCIPWEFEERHDSARSAMLDGYTKFYNNQTFLVDDYNIYTEITNDNVTNFDLSLRSKYQNSFVEIVSESSFSAPGFMITEKTLNSVYGCNFPILLSGVGAVEHLRQVGFDLFDDIVDHSYDLIANPFDRIIAAIDLNHRLLVDADHVKQQWQINRHRFENNVVIAKTKLYQWYQDRTINQFGKLKWH